MVMEEPILHICSAHCYVTTTLALDIQNSSVANGVSPSSYFCEVKPSLIYEDEFMLVCISIHLQNSLKKRQHYVVQHRPFLNLHVKRVCMECTVRSVHNLPPHIHAAGLLLS